MRKFFRFVYFLEVPLGAGGKLVHRIFPSPNVFIHVKDLSPVYFSILMKILAFFLFLLNIDILFDDRKTASKLHISQHNGEKHGFTVNYVPKWIFVSRHKFI